MLVLAAPLLLAAAGTAALEADICAAEGACRTVETLAIEGPDGNVRTIELDITLPWVAEGNVVLTPGESVTVALEEVDGELMPRLVRTGEASNSTEPTNGEIRFSFSAFNRGQLMLSAKSARSDTIDYAALMVTINNGPERTSVCSLMPGITVFESWQAPIYQVALWSFRPTTEPGCKTLDFPRDGAEAGSS